MKPPFLEISAAAMLGLIWGLSSLGHGALAQTGRGPVRQETTLALRPGNYLEGDRRPLAPGSEAPSASLTGCAYDPNLIAGKSYDLLPGSPRDERRATLVVFWGFWCDTWRDTTETFNRMRPQLRAHGIQVMAVAVDASSQPVCQPAYKAHRIWWPVLIDAKGAAGKAWGVRRVPTFFLVSPTGKILRTWEGFPGQAAFWRETGQVLADPQAHAG